MYLYLEINLSKLTILLKSKIKSIINKELHYELITKLVFNGIMKNNQQTRTFRSKINQLNNFIRAVYLETVLSQSYQIKLAVRVILKTNYLKQSCNSNLSFS